ncbi:hypothetical protein M408DRAFT_304828 [Serendipita vermifera MAFF 305830]|uniref:Uncharacterized protein n=1 Tax=Serendipita vermifera MAFF 305830 TaxID=933852 RepID=A0A0C3BCM3_SERVB|nr:hypothetical protein M408DRAFT_304828 [Serendipita vermifera MAFF 305830]
MSIHSDSCILDTSQALQDCVVCFERESPSTFSPDLLTALQLVADQFFTGCLLIGSPVPPILITTPTGDTSSATTPTGSAADGTTSGVIIPIVAVIDSYTTPSAASRIAGTVGGIVGFIFLTAILFWFVHRHLKQQPKVNKVTPPSGQGTGP